MSCPYMSALPRNMGQVFSNKVQFTAEWAMWVEWALVRDQGWWKKENKEIGIGNEMVLWDPVLDRLRDLNVPVNEVASMQRVGGTYYNEAHRVLDMVKLIDWAKRTKPVPAKEWKRLELMKAHQLLVPHIHTQDQMRCYRQD